MVEICCVFLVRYVGSGPLGVMACSVYIYVSAMLYLRGCGGLFTHGGTLQQKIEVCGQQLVSPGGNQQIAALSNCEPLSPSAYYYTHGHRWQLDALFEKNVVLVSE